MRIIQNRRRFMTTALAAGTACALGDPTNAWAEAAPETTKLRLPKTFRAVCEAPKNITFDLLAAEGFTDVEFVEPPMDFWAALLAGEFDFNTDFPPPAIMEIDKGSPIRILAGLHSGCLELIVRDTIRSVADLKGKKVGVFSLTSAPHVLVTMMAAYVGLDPAKDIEWVESPDKSAMDLFNEGKVDAFLGAPPEPQEQRSRKVGHTIVNTTTDRPWSQHFCCMLAATTDYVERNPVATKRVMRAMLKAADLCAAQPELAASLSVERKFTDNYDYAVLGLKESRYDVWREFDPEDTMRFYALRMNELGFIKSAPNEIIEVGTDWRFVNELKQELRI